MIRQSIARLSALVLSLASSPGHAAMSEEQLNETVRQLNQATVLATADRESFVARAGPGLTVVLSHKLNLTSEQWAAADKRGFKQWHTYKYCNDQAYSLFKGGGVVVTNEYLDELGHPLTAYTVKPEDCF